MFGKSPEIFQKKIQAQSSDTIQIQKFESQERNKPIKKIKKDQKHFRILAIDGGGIRGIIPSIVLQYLEQKSGKPICQLFDLVSGCSTGALLAGVLTLPKGEKREPKYTAKEATDLYYNECPKIFKQSLARKMISFWGLNDPLYSQPKKQRIINSYTQDLKILDCLTDIIIPAYDVHYGQPYFFKSNSARENPSLNFPMTNVLDATSSAPTYFKPSKLDLPNNDYYSFVDGALVANNPSLCALAEAVKHYDIKPEQIVLISIGTGNQTIKKTYEETKGWGALSWAKYFPNSLISASMYTCHYQIEQVLSNVQYYRLQAEIQDFNHARIDDVSKQNMEWLTHQANDLVREQQATLDKICDLLLDI